MSDTTETLAAIVAEMRDGIHTGRSDIIDCVNDRLRSCADRIEAAAERERAELRRQLRNEIEINDALATVRPQLHYVDDVVAEAAKERAHEIELAKLRAPGNAAAMREALENAISVFRDDLPTPRDISRAFAAANAALAAPARNCDILSEEAANKAWDDYRHANVLPRGGWDFRHIIAWLFAPAEGGAE